LAAQNHLNSLKDLGFSTFLAKQGNTCHVALLWFVLGYHHYVTMVFQRFNKRVEDSYSFSIFPNHKHFTGR
jgi:hypothetical protein